MKKAGKTLVSSGWRFVVLPPRTTTTSSRSKMMMSSVASSHTDSKMPKKNGDFDDFGRRSETTLMRPPKLFDALAYLVPSVVCATLGYWQLLRREEKRQKIAHRTKAFLEMDPLHAISDVTETTEEFRRVKVEGVLVESKSIEIGPKVRTLSEISNNEKRAGHEVITPMRERRPQKRSRKKRFWWWPFHSDDARDDDDDAIVALVNRGFAERGFEDAAAKKGGGLCLKTIGVVRKGDRKGYFTPENVPEKNVWHYVDVRGIGEHLGLVVGKKRRQSEDHHPEGGGTKENAFVPYVQLIAPVGAVASRQQPIPVDEEEIMTFAVLPEQHLQYSATWFSLSAVTLGMACVAMRKKTPPPRPPKRVVARNTTTL